MVKNQDDCVAINQGSNFLIEGLYCSGGHGLSLSVGQSGKNGNPNTVQNVTFNNCTVENSLNGIHVKTHKNAGTGSISDVTYKDIKLSGKLSTNYNNSYPLAIYFKNTINIRNQRYVALIGLSVTIS